MYTVFQSTFPRGERRPYSAKFRGLRNFNPRSRVGNDKFYYIWCGRGTDFNPRSRVGNDYLWLKETEAHKISIHVPAWGTT